ncbi:MAG: dephospho-CoA kinase [Gemmatimonadaceae bacterium]
MLYVGLTGNIASGKTRVGQRLAQLGATIVDADVLAREAVQPGSDGLRQVTDRWGSAVLASDGTLDREALRHIVFADPGQLEELNAIIHPGVGRLRGAMVDAARARGDAVLIYIVPLLFERHLAEEFDSIVLVDAPESVRLARLTEQREVSGADAGNMIAAQMPAQLKRARADFVIENDGTLEHLLDQVDAVWERLTAYAARPSLAS